jgi:hypothetical protein
MADGAAKAVGKGAFKGTKLLGKGAVKGVKGLHTG